MTKAQILHRIRVIVLACKTQADAAKKLGVSAQYLGDVLANRREPGKKILKRLKIKKVVGYEAAK